jgi:hypothetical protein
LKKSHNISNKDLGKEKSKIKKGSCFNLLEIKINHIYRLEIHNSSILYIKTLAIAQQEQSLWTYLAHIDFLTFHANCIVDFESINVMRMVCMVGWSAKHQR